MNRPAQVSAGDPGPPDDAHELIRAAIARLRPGGSKLEDIKAAIADVLYRDLRQAAALRELLDDAHRERRLGMEDYRRLSAELHRLVTEEVPTDGIPERPASARKRRPAAQTKRVGAGSLLGQRYLLEECIAQGPLSDVYRAGDRWRAELMAGTASVAVKVLAPADDGIVDRDKLRRQALLAQELAHPNICRVFGVDRDGTADYVVIEWLDGESLATLMDRCHPDPLEASRLRAVVDATASALDHALGRGLVHGDLKPANVFVCADGRIKLLDFGLVRGDSAAPAVTPEYASCEVLEGRSPEPSDDVFSFGVMIYRAMTGSRPFGRRSALEAEADGAKAERVPELDDEQWASLERALAFRRADRDIGALRLAATLTRSPEIPRARTTHQAQENRPWAVYALVAVAAAGTALLATRFEGRVTDWWQSRNRPPPAVAAPAVETVPVETVQLEPIPVRTNLVETPSEVTPGVAALPVDPRVDGEPVSPSQATESMAGEAEPEADPRESSMGLPAGDSDQPEPAEPAIAAAEPGVSGSALADAAPAERIVTETPVTPTVGAAAASGQEPDATPMLESAAVSNPAPESIELAAARLPGGGALGFRDGTYEADETDGFVKLRLRAPAGHPGIRLRLWAGPGTAEFGTDFALAEEIVEIEPGRTSAEILWPLVDDARDEYLEEVEILLESLTDGYPVTRGDALIIIFDDDGPQPAPDEPSQP